MIIAGYAGIGKTTFARKNKNALDLSIMPYKYSNLDEISSKYNGEKIKASPELKLNPNWRYEYYDKLISLFKSEFEKIIVIPTDIRIMEWLEEDGIPFTVVYPAIDLKEEYRNRYISRGNNEDFINVFIGDWDWWISMLKSQQGCDKIELKANEYLSDVKTLMED